MSKKGKTQRWEVGGGGGGEGGGWLSKASNVQVNSTREHLIHDES